MTFIIIKVIDIALGLRVDESQEEAGLDIAVHGETAYVPWSGSTSGIVSSDPTVEAATPPATTEAEPA